MQVGRRHTFIPLSRVLCPVHGGFYSPPFISSVHCPLIDNNILSRGWFHFSLLPVSTTTTTTTTTTAAHQLPATATSSRVCFSVPGFWVRNIFLLFSSSEIIQNIGLCRPCFCRSHPFSSASACAATSAFNSSLAQHAPRAPNVDRLPPALPFSTLHSLLFTTLGQSLLSLSLFCRSSFSVNLEIASESWFHLHLHLSTSTSWTRSTGRH